MNRRLQLLFHFTAASVLGYGLYYDIWYVKPPQEYLDKSINFGWKWKYLTFIDANIQLLYFAFCCIVDILTSNESTTANLTTLQRIRDTFFSTVVFPIGLFVCVTFWGLFAIDRDLVYPTILDTFIPVWLNHVMHTVILPFDLIEQAVCFHRYLSTPKGLLLSGGAMVLYALWQLKFKNFSKEPWYCIELTGFLPSKVLLLALQYVAAAYFEVWISLYQAEIKPTASS